MLNKSFFIFIIITIIFINCLICLANNYNVTESTDNIAKINANEVLLFIVDFSDSMRETMRGKSKIDMALESMDTVLPLVPQDTKVGLRVYGHKNGFTPNQACRASQLLVTPAQGAASNISSTLQSLTPRGVTPITYSLKQAVDKDLLAYPYNYKKHIILISDGKENCDESPCAYVIELMKKRDDIMIDVIALGLDDDDAINQLKCVAYTTNGRFYDAKTSWQFQNSLMRSINAQKEVQGEIILK